MTERSHPLRGALAALVLVAAPLLLTGCSGSCPVEGTVTLDGQPVDGGIIEFQPADGAPGTSRTTVHADIKNGKYSLGGGNGPAAGSYKVAIHWLKKTGRQVDVTGDAGNKQDETQECVPARYNSQSTTVVEIKSGTNTFNYELHSEKSGKKTTSSRE
jgi:hypothetical protein